MTRICFFLTVALVLAAAAPVQAQWQEQVADQIQFAATAMAESNYGLIDDSKTGALEANETTRVSLRFTPGNAYVILGVCDVDCTDIDLWLLDPDGEEIDIDVEVDDRPVLALMASDPRPYTVVVGMVTCSQEPCFYGLGVFEDGAAKGVKSQGGTTHQGTLASGDDKLRSGEYADRYSFQVLAGQRVVVDLESPAFDTYIILEQPGDEQVENDDFERSQSHSRVEVVAPQSGEWTAVATSFEVGEEGAYTLRISIDEATTDDGTRFESGTLASDDDTLDSGEYADVYSVAVQTGEFLVVDLRSADFDPYLIVHTPDGEQLDNDDHEGDASRSLISFTAASAGTVDIITTSYKPGETGTYDVRIDRSAAAVAKGPRIELGSLAAPDDTLRSGEFADIYRFDGRPGQRVTVDLTSDAFDTYLIVKDPNGEQVENDDTDRAGHSVVEMDVTESGRYSVLVTSFEPGETGAYQLLIDLTDRAVAVASDQRDVTTVAVDGSAQGRLEAGDATRESGAYKDLYVFEGRAGQSILVAMTSSEFDTYLEVTLPNGETITNDDFNGSTSRSQVELELREAGRYRIVATAYAPDQGGSYEVMVRRSAATSMPGASPREGRLYGIFSGISDYGGRMGDLDYTAEDAIRVRDAMIDGAGMRPEDAIVLTDADATTTRLAAAIRQLAPRIGPNDQFVFFYSGHGGRDPRPGGPQSTDPDALDETLELYDAGITDDEFSEMLSAINAGTTILILDSCFSGGFSKDVISVPGRIGFFSSEEDVTSSVAVKFRAGGFLSVFVADAVGDRLADIDHDGTVTAIELSQYLHERYRGDLKSGGPGDFVRTSGPQRGYQHLVVDRGSISPYQPLFRP